MCLMTTLRFFFINILGKHLRKVVCLLSYNEPLLSSIHLLTVSVPTVISKIPVVTFFFFSKSLTVISGFLFPSLAGIRSKFIFSFNQYSDSKFSQLV